jgi:uncharacterized protein YjbJ (UPF0337 family)
MSSGDKITGRLKKAAGDLLGDAELHREGAQEERKGEAKEEARAAAEQADAKAREVADLERRTR